MTDPVTLREQLERLARGASVPPWESTRTIEDASAVRDDVEAAAAFAADGGRERLAEAIEAAERAGDEERAAEGRSVLAAFGRFEAACSGGADPRSVDVDAYRATSSEPLSRRSRNP